MLRSSGVVCPLFALPSPYGIGCLGEEAVRFAKQLQAAGFTYWQILPYGPTSVGDSPYQSPSTYAGNPYYIDLRPLAQEGLLSAAELSSAVCKKTEEIDGKNYLRVDYGHLWKTRYILLRKAFSRLTKHHVEAVSEFAAAETWLEDYVLYSALKNAHGHRPWWCWSKEYASCDTEALRHFANEQHHELSFQRFLQYMFFSQWRRLKKKINELGIFIIGDLPIYVARDSCDVWSNRGLFELDDEGIPTRVAGVPPDVYSPDGQLWGNPLYRWDVLRQTGYRWWLDRIGAAVRDLDLVRLDHFRGFEAYYAVPYGDKTARNGTWEKGPGMDLFAPILRAFPHEPFIVEDLGFITDEVKVFLEETGLPGMQVMQFNFNPDSATDVRPHDYPKNLAAYASTHDSDTLLGWLGKTDEATSRLVRDYAGIDKDAPIEFGPKSGTVRKLLRLLWQTQPDLVLVQVQDLLGQGNAQRTNIPGTDSGNWIVRFFQEELDSIDTAYYARQNQVFRRSGRPVSDVGDNSVLQLTAEGV